MNRHTLCRRTRASLIAFATVPIALLLGFAAYGAPAPSLSRLEELGKRLFFDSNLSTPPGQACAACHGPGVGFTGPVSSINASGGVYPGAFSSRFGNRKPPAAAYAGASPTLHYDASGGTWVGGMFWDGRATGWSLGDPLAEQAQGPFLNPLEQNNPNAKAVVTAVSHSGYADLFVQVWGAGSLDPIKDVAGSYERIARSIAAYERSAEVNPFSSKYDYYLKHQARLTRLESKGLELFEGKANCAACHPNRVGPSGEPPLFTDFTYDNLGVPRNPANPFYTAPTSTNPAGAMWVDLGLGAFLAAHGYADQAAANYGKQKVPTLRNVDRRPDPGFVKAYGHNAYFKSLEEIVHFYNTRDVIAWPAPEVAATVNHTELGNLGLTPAEEAAVVAFLKTLSDGYVLPMAPLLAQGIPAGDAELRRPTLPTAVELAASQPNPANENATIAFALPVATEIDLTVYDLTGREVCTLASGSFAAGKHSVIWNGRNSTGSPVAGGTYFYRLRASGVSLVRRMVWLR